jgi:hypothetical protein
MTAVDGEVCQPWPGFRDGVAGITHLQPPWGGRIDGLAAASDNHGVWSGSGPGDMVVLFTIRSRHTIAHIMGPARRDRTLASASLHS